MSRPAHSWMADVLLKLAKLQTHGSRGERFLRLVADARSRIAEISPEAAAAALDRGALLLDVREKEEFQRGHIPRSVHLSRGTVEWEIEKYAPEAGKEIVAYCGGGNRSALVVENLQRMGYTNAKSLAGGFQAWLEAGLSFQRNNRLMEDW